MDAERETGGRSASAGAAAPPIGSSLSPVRFYVGTPPNQPAASNQGTAAGHNILSLPPKEYEEESVYRWPELICVYVAIIADAIVANVIAPYAVSWVRDSFDVGDNVGLYSGLLVGSFTFATAITSPFFGWLSDIVGRRVLMAGGLFSAGILTLIGGLSGKYWIAFSFRFLAGLLDASQTVSFAAIGDLTTGEARFVAFGYSKGASQVAKILTSLIGGLTYNIKPDPIFKNLPGYDTVLLSHMIAFGSCLAGTLLIIVLYREGPEFTRVTKRIQRVKSAIRLQQGDSLLSLVSAQSLSELMDKEAVTYNSGAGPTAPAPQQQEQQHHHHHVFFNSPDRPRNSPLRHRRRLLSERLLKDEVTFEDEPTLLHLMASRLSAGAVSSAPSEGAHEQRPVGVASAAMPTSPPLLPRGDFSTSLVGRPSFWAGVRYVLTNPLLVRLILVYSLASFCNGGLFLSISLLAQADGGYDMHPKDASIIFLFFGSWAIVFNAFLFKPVVTRLGQKRANGIGLILTGVGILGLPLGDYYIRSHTVELWSCIVISVLVFGSSYMLINSLLASFVSLHASREMQGIAQGIAMFCSQITSGVGPIAFGALHNALEAPIPVFLFLTAGYLMCFVVLVVVPREVLEKSKKDPGDDD